MIPSPEPNPDRATGQGCVLAVVLFILAVFWSLTEAIRDTRARLNHPAIVDSAYLAFALWAGLMALWITTTEQEWQERRGRFTVFRLQNALAWLMTVLHIGIAFHHAHHWSHSHAWDHVHAASGFGPGIFVTYSFIVIWFLDVLNSTLTPGKYVTRSRTVIRVVHGFAAFIMFNATVVFGTSPMRWVAAGVFGLLISLRLVQWVRGSATSPSSSSP